MIQVITTFYGVLCILPQTIQILCHDYCVVEFASVVGYSILTKLINTMSYLDSYFILVAMTIAITTAQMESSKLNNVVLR